MDPTVTLIVVVLLIALVLLLSFILFELRAQAHERDELEKALLMALFRISKQNLEKHKALAAVLLKALGQGPRVRLLEEAGETGAEPEEGADGEAVRAPRASEGKGES